MKNEFFEMIQFEKAQQELTELISCNEKTERFGLCLDREEAYELIVCRNESLKKYQRVEFGSGILDKLIFAFCDSAYINQDNYVETIKRLQDIFYEYKNESGDLLTDEELLNFMVEQYEEVCFGDADYLESTCLNRFAAAIRAGYDGYQKSAGKHEYEQLAEESRWDKNLYLEILQELFW